MNLQEEVEKWLEMFRNRLCTKEDVHEAIYLLLEFFAPRKEEEA